MKLISIIIVAALVGLTSCQSTGAGGSGADNHDMAAMEAAMIAYGTPGNHHSRLHDATGTWHVVNRMWMGPGAEVMVSEGTSTFAPVMNGLFSRQDYTGDWMGQTFTGVGLNGYDNAKGEHIGIWMDSMSSGMSLSHGTCSDDCRVVTYRGKSTDPVTGGTKRYKFTIREVDPVTTVFEMWDTDLDFLSMEMVYTRA